MLIMMEEKADARDPTVEVSICEGHHKMTPKEVKTYCSLDELQGIADSAHGELMQIREDIAHCLRPKPKRKAAKTG